MPRIMTNHTIFTLSQYGICCFSLQFMTSIVSEIVCITFFNDYFKIERKIRIPAPCLFYPGFVCIVCGVSCSSFLDKLMQIYC